MIIECDECVGGIATVYLEPLGEYVDEANLCVQCAEMMGYDSDGVWTGDGPAIQTERVEEGEWLCL